MPYAKLMIEETSRPVKGGIVGYPIVLKDVRDIFEHECRVFEDCTDCPLRVWSAILGMTCEDITDKYPGLIPSVFGYSSIKEEGYYNSLVQNGLIDPKYIITEGEIKYETHQ